MFKTLNNVMFERIKRLEAVIGTTLSARKFTIEDSKQLQHDAYSLRGALEQDLFKGWAARAVEVEKARAMVAGWDAVLRKDSAPAAIYLTWRAAVDRDAFAYDRPNKERQALVEAGLAKADGAAHQGTGDGLDDVAVRADAHARLPTSVRDGVRSADG